MSAHNTKAKIEGPAGCVLAIIALAFIGCASIAIGVVSLALAVLEVPA